MKLIKLNNEYIHEIEEFKSEMKEANSSWDGCSLIQKYEDIQEWVSWVTSLEYLIFSKDEPNVVPAVQYILVDNDRIIGMFNLRLLLSGVFLEYGGHIGYAIRPSERRKGYAVKGLRLLLEECKKYGLDRVSITASTNNEASIKTIQKCGGIFKEDFTYRNLPHKRFIIPLFEIVNGEKYEIIKYLGKGKGGYSYLVENNNNFYVLKQIHHEPCDYYSFGNKIESEINDYQRILNTSINIPKMIDVDIQNERILKEYIDGPTIFYLVKEDKMKDEYLSQIKKIAFACYEKGLNIDYFPTNFVVQNDVLYYVDYECNNYMEEWNFENWGIKYWSQTKEFLDYLKNH